MRNKTTPEVGKLNLGNLMDDGKRNDSTPGINKPYNSKPDDKLTRGQQTPT